MYCKLLSFLFIPTMSFEQIVQKVGEVILKYDNYPSLIDFNTNDLKYFPLDYLIKRVSAIELQSVWENLPEPYKANKELQLRLPCLKHYNRTEDLIHIDGPPPSRKHCYLCK